MMNDNFSAMFKIVLLEGDKNDATHYYISIIQEAIEKAGNQVEIIESLSGIRRDDVLIVITPKAFWKVKKQCKHVKVLYWFQGVIPEEVDFYSYPYFKRVITKSIYSLLEIFILKNSTYNFFVSNTMAAHYKNKYHYKNDNYFVMPCFNQDIQTDAFFQSKYDKPTFVYTGNLAKWQCFEEMLLLYKQIFKVIPSAELTIYTKEQEKAKKLLEQNGVSADVKYVPYQKLSDEIKQYKYGFLLREDNVVNNVATPTKMNSYLASGIIPIYSDVIGAFSENLSYVKYAIPIRSNIEGVKRVCELEQQKVCAKEVFEDFSRIFDTYFNREQYVDRISKIIIDLK